MKPIATLTLNPALDLSTATPRVHPTHKLRCAPPQIEPGGGGINVARVVHALGAPVTAIFPAGGGTGTTLEGLLRADGVPTAPVPIRGSTRESFAVDETETGEQFRFVLPGPELSENEVAALLDRLRTLAPSPAFVVASGSLPAGCPDTVLADVARVAQADGARLIVDTSGPALAACEGSRAYLIKPSLRELEELVGKTLPDIPAAMAAARDLRMRGFAEIVVVSLGEAGALLVADTTTLHLPAIPVRVESTVGAGDSMVAAMTVALARGEPLSAVLRYGLAGGAAAVTTQGSALARREDVERLYAEASSRA